MRHKPALTATARLILLVVASNTHPMSLVELSNVTQASPYTIRRATQTMVAAACSYAGPSAT
jgi:hypothetical protein